MKIKTENKRAYVAPKMTCIHLKSDHPVLAGSPVEANNASFGTESNDSDPTGTVNGNVQSNPFTGLFD